MLVLNQLALFVIISTSVPCLASFSKIYRSPSKITRRSHSPRVNSQEIRWASFISVARKSKDCVAFPEPLRSSDLESLYLHLISYPSDQHHYNALCGHMDGVAFKAITSFIIQDDDILTVPMKQAKLLSPDCIARIPEHNWSLASKRFVQETNLGVHNLPSKSIAQLTPKTFELMGKNFHALQKLTGHNFSQWCQNLSKAHFNPDNWNGDLWQLLTPECVAAIEKPKVQQAAVNIICGEGIKVADGVSGIRESEIVDHGLRIIRLKSIQRHLARTQSTKGMVEYFERKSSLMHSQADVLLQRNLQLAAYKEPSTKMLRRIDLLSLIGQFSKIGSANKEALPVVKRFMEYFGTDIKAAVTWEILSKFIIKNTDADMVKYIGLSIGKFSTSNLPIDSMIIEACISGSSKVLLTLVHNVRCREMIGRIGYIVNLHKQNLGFQYTLINESINNLLNGSISSAYGSSSSTSKLELSVF